jgi:hypothetical protein
MVKVAGQIGRLTRTVAFAAIVCALVLKTLAFASSPYAVRSTFGASAAVSVFVPADDCNSGGGAPERGPLHDRGHCVLCVSCGAGTQADRVVLPAEEIAFAPTRDGAAWRGGDTGAPASSAPSSAWRARAPPASA